MQRSDRVLEIGCGIGFLGTIASRIVGGTVRCYDANPAMSAAACRTIERNGAVATVINAVLEHKPSASTTVFYVHEDFWSSSLTPKPGTTAISVPVLDVAREITKHDASYLIVDIEGGETDLLRERLPACVGSLCVECHPNTSGPDDITTMMISLFSQGFTLDLERSRPPVLYFARPLP
jgi:FkbM family methyltransferase